MGREKTITVKQVETWVRLYELNTYRAKYRKMKREDYGCKLKDFFDGVIKHDIQYGGEDLIRLREAYRQYKKLTDDII